MTEREKLKREIELNRQTIIVCTPLKPAQRWAFVCSLWSGGWLVC